MNLRKREQVDLALCGYDYAINGNKKALDRLITADAAQQLGGDYMTIAMMGMLDEWDRTFESVWRHIPFSDGTAGETVSGFFYCKLGLFPESYAKFRESISTEQKVVERLASTVADDPKLDHDRGKFYRFWGWEDRQEQNPNFHDRVGFYVKELPRDRAESLIFVAIGKGRRQEDLDKKRNFVLEPIRAEKGGKRVWKDVTDRVLPDKKYRSIYLKARRKDNVIETAIYVAPYTRGNDLVWEGGKFIVRKADGEKLTRHSREPYSPSR